MVLHPASIWLAVTYPRWRICAPLVDPGPITCNRTRRAAALLLCNRTLRGGRPAPNGTLLVHTPTYSNVVGHIWIYSIFQLP